MLVPTLDVDLIWHVHMLSPLDYRDDCMNLLGRVLSHDATIEDSDLATAFERTKERWHAAHSTPYVWRPDPKKQQVKNDSAVYAGCGSCGWGHHDFHRDLDHNEQEAAVVTQAYGQPAVEGAPYGTSLDVDDDQMMVEPVAWARDAPADHFTAGTGAGGGEIMSDPWAAPPATEGSSESSGSWGWGGDSSGGSGDSAGCGSCGGGCGGD